MYIFAASKFAVNDLPFAVYCRRQLPCIPIIFSFVLYTLPFQIMEQRSFASPEEEIQYLKNRVKVLEKESKDIKDEFEGPSTKNGNNFEDLGYFMPNNDNNTENDIGNNPTYFSESDQNGQGDPVEDLDCLLYTSPSPRD